MLGHKSDKNVVFSHFLVAKLQYFRGKPIFFEHPFLAFPAYNVGISAQTGATLYPAYTVFDCVF